MSASSQEALHQLQAVLTAKHYSPRTIRNYMQEMRFIFAHYPDLLPASITSQHIVSYINFIITAHGVGREKCHQVAQSCSFFFKHVLPSPFVILYFTTQSNIIAAVEDGRVTYEEAEAWLRDELSFFFDKESDRRQINFGNWIRYIQRLD